MNVLDKKPYISNGHLKIPYKIPLGGEMKPPLKPGEWFCWLLDNCRGKVDYKFYKELVGSRTTIWRIRKMLSKKGYIK